MKKYFLLSLPIVATVAVLAAGFAIYLYKYQQIIYEEARILDERCLMVEPLIVDKQKKTFKWFNVYYNNSDSKEISDLYKDYKQSTEKYLEITKD